MKGRVTARQQRACDDGASSGARRRAEEEESDERHWGASARGPAERARARPQPGHARTSSGARSLAPPNGRRSRVCGTLAAIFHLTV
uniref:Uncharacterized protein n=1 Tax=Globodera rostochiensis TaxID=31243 RepID=A0A914GVU3_GLORO